MRYVSKALNISTRFDTNLQLPPERVSRGYEGVVRRKGVNYDEFRTVLPDGAVKHVGEKAGSDA